MSRSSHFCRVWLGMRLRDYELAYLDPKICDPALRKDWFSQLIPIRSTGEIAPMDFLSQFMEALGVRRQDTSASFSKKGGLGSRIRTDRARQRRVAQVIKQYIEEDKKRHYESVGSLRKKKPSPAELADKPKADSLIILDAMFTRRITAPKEIQRMVDISVKESDDFQGRSIECMLTDGPAPLTTLRDPAIGLMVDAEAFYECTAATLVGADWYPFTRTIGFYRTSSSGLPFVDVIAILTRPFPSFYEVLASLPESEQPWGLSLPEAFEYIGEHLLAPEVQRLQGLVPTPPNAAPTPPTAAPTPPSAAPAPASAAPAPAKVYDKDEQFLDPIHFFRLCCQLNRIGWQDLKIRLQQVARIFENYLKSIRQLQGLLATLDIESRILSQETDPVKLVPDQPEWREGMGLLTTGR